MQFESNSHDEVQEEAEDNQIVLPQSNDFYVIFSFTRNVDLAIHYQIDLLGAIKCVFTIGFVTNKY